jgi:hypothetical protein
MFKQLNNEGATKRGSRSDFSLHARQTSSSLNLQKDVKIKVDQREAAMLSKL